MTTIPANVKRGAALLDERLPNWRERIDPTRLQLESGCNCVIGQVLGSYDEGLDLLGLDWNTDGPKYGFFIRGRQTWSALTDAWRAVIARD